ncbi:hypothetical protein NC651_015086 [Populus alba x Populus x berolinensis]|nr:hypothetical protein NC651_015086 [Populus alba x Populus x berolinensis]
MNWKNLYGEIILWAILFERVVTYCTIYTILFFFLQMKSGFTLFHRGKDENPDCNQCRRRQSSEMFLIKIFLSMLSILVFEDHHSLSWDWKFFCR